MQNKPNDKLQTMNLSLIKSLKTIDLIIVGFFALISIYIYIGFYFPDPYTLSYGTNAIIILSGVKIIFPVIVAGIIAFYAGFRTKKFERGAAVILIVSSFLSLYIGYTVADSFYQQWFDDHRQEYHPYLQLKPVDYKLHSYNSLNTIKVFCLGGSTTELPDSYGKDWSSRVEKIIQTKYGMQNVEVYNLGRQWYTTLHTLINYETNLRQHKPSVIIIMQSVNDLLQNADFSYFSRGVFREDYGHFYGPANRIIDRRSLWRYLRDVISGIWYAKARQKLTTDNFPGLQAYERNINTIIELAKRDSTQVLLMSEPYLLKEKMSSEEISSIGMLKVEAINDTLVWSSETVLHGMQQYNNTLRTIAQQKDVLFADLEKEVPKSLIFFRDEVHYRDTTFSIIAPFIAKQLYEILKSKNKEIK